MAESRSRSVTLNPGMMGSGDTVVQALKVPPHSVEAEQSLLGGLLIDNSSWDNLGGVLNDKDFYRPEHALIYKVIARLVGDNHPADVITVYDAVKSEQGGDLVSIDYLNSLAQNTPSAANIKGYADIVRDRSILRRLIEVSDSIVNSAFVPEGRTVRTLLDEAESRILQIGEEGSRKADYLEIEPLLKAVVARIDELYNRQGGSDITGIATGFLDLDKQTSGLQKGDLVIVAGRPSMGKTSLALNMAENVALDTGLPVAVFSMEMASTQLTMRLLGSVGRLDQHKMRTGRLEDDDWERLTHALGKLNEAPIHIDEGAGLNSFDIRARARRLSRQCGKLGLIVIDYLQLMSPPGGRQSENRATEISEMSRSLKALAKELDVPVVALSQLNRSVEQRPDKRPVMSDLRESGAIEQDADLILFIYRDEVYNPDTPDKGVAEIIIAKQRNGPIGRVRLTFLGEYTRFENFANPGFQSYDE